MADDAVVPRAKRRRREEEEVVQAIVHCEASFLAFPQVTLYFSQLPTRLKWAPRISSC